MSCAVVCLAVACAPGEDAAGVGVPIIGGALDSERDAVVYVLSRTGGTLYSCSGTVIAPRVVLTAAHCLDGGDRAAWVWFGAEDRPAPLDPADPGYVAGEALALHPDFDLRRVAGDVGLILLRDRAPVTPAAVRRAPLRREMLDRLVTIVGFGRIDADGSTARRRYATELTLIHYDPWVVGAFGEGRSSCGGDSGGPMLLVDAGREEVIGVTATASTACDGNTVNARLDAHLPFIDRWIQENDSSITCDAGDWCVADCGGEIDPDCDSRCFADGECLEGCAVVDPDCPEAPRPPEPLAPGEACDGAEQCASGICAAIDEVTFCATPCDRAPCAGTETCIPTTEGAQVCAPAGLVTPRSNGGCSVTLASPRGPAPVTLFVLLWLVLGRQRVAYGRPDPARRLEVSDETGPLAPAPRRGGRAASRA